MYMFNAANGLTNYVIAELKLSLQGEVACLCHGFAMWHLHTLGVSISAQNHKQSTPTSV